MASRPSAKSALARSSASEPTSASEPSASEPSAGSCAAHGSVDERHASRQTIAGSARMGYQNTSSGPLAADGAGGGAEAGGAEGAGRAPGRGGAVARPTGAPPAADGGDALWRGGGAV